MEKAYKLLALQEKISNNQAKELIDRGLVFAGNQKLKVARTEFPENTKFRVNTPKKIATLFEDDVLIAINKPVGITSEEAELSFKGASLIHRLDRDTSGVLLLSKDDAFKEEAIKEFKKQNVYKEYVAIIEGIIAEETTIDKPIKTTRGSQAYSKVAKDGKPAITHLEPIAMLDGKKTKLKIVIETGLTHQIRVHLKDLGFPVIGDEKYGGKSAERLFLHAKKIKLLGYEIEAPEAF